MPSWSGLSGSSLPEWNIYQPGTLEPDHRDFIVMRDTHMRMPIEKIVDELERGLCDTVVIHNYVQHMDNFLSANIYRRVFVDSEPQTGLIADDELLINVRGNEILGGGAPDYLLIPVDYFQEIVRETGLRPVIMGQLTPGPYLDELRAALPEARLVPSLGTMKDFSLIRSARNIVISVSTFSWLAAWLSEARQIFMPVAGVFSPFQRPDIDLLPLDDPRYRFDLFPVYFAAPAAEMLAHLRSLRGAWRRMPSDKLRRLIRERPRFPVDLDKVAEFFDEEYYLRTYWDVNGAKQSGAVPSGFEHFMRAGHKESREPLELDRAWYCRRYPIAGMEIGQGDYANCHHHYVEIGAARGYSPRPVEGERS